MTQPTTPPATTQPTTQPKAKLIDLLGEFDNAMLVTHAADGSIDGRPMAIAKVDSDGDLWFASDRHSGKVAEIKADDDVSVMMQQSNRFVSLRGKCQLVDDQSKKDELWREAWKVWFPGGKTDPSLVLLHIDATEGEYWDNSGAEGMAYLIRAGLAYVAGERAETGEAINAKVDL